MCAVALEPVSVSGAHNIHFWAHGSRVARIPCQSEPVRRNWWPYATAAAFLAGGSLLQPRQLVPSPARKNAVAWPMAARVAFVSLRALSIMKSWMVPS